MNAPMSDLDESYDPTDYHDNTDRWVGEIELTPVDPVANDAHLYWPNDDMEDAA